MATRALIGLQLNDGSILSAYHHWDGYPAWLGKVLTKEYNTKEKVAELIDGGDMSSCQSDSIWGEQLPEGQFAPEYYSARGETCPPKLYKDLNEMCIGGDECGAEYVYHFEDDKWRCHQLNFSPDPNQIKEMELNTDE